jgi:hypothetical protein
VAVRLGRHVGINPLSLATPVHKLSGRSQSRAAQCQAVAQGIETPAFFLSSPEIKLE